MKNASTGYVSLPQSPDTEVKEKWPSEETLVLNDKPLGRSPTLAGRIGSLLFKAAYIGTVISSLFTIALLLKAKPPAPTHPNDIDISTLDRPSIYIDLAKAHEQRPLMVRNSTIINLPNDIGLVSVHNAGKVIGMDVDHWIKSPTESQVEISGDISTIIQMRVLDYGMESCQVTVDIPSLSTLQSRKKSRTIHLSGDTSSIEVWRLDDSKGKNKEIDPRLLSRSQLPPRKELLGRLDVQVGKQSKTMEFACHERELMTFELACPTSNCGVKFWQDKDAPVFGFHVLQHESM